MILLCIVIVIYIFLFSKQQINKKIMLDKGVYEQMQEKIYKKNVSDKV